MDLLLQKRISEFKSAKLPKKLIGYVHQTGHKRSDFIDYREWSLYASLYEVLVSLRDHENFSNLVTGLFEYLDRHPTYATTVPEAADRPLTRKEKRKRRKGRAKDKGSSGVSSWLKKAKPSTASMIANWKASPIIGLGLESTLPTPQRVRREDIKIDKHTKPNQNSDRSHVLYTAGWSLSPDDQ